MYWAAQKRFNNVLEVLLSYGDRKETETEAVEKCMLILLEEELDLSMAAVEGGTMIEGRPKSRKKMACFLLCSVDDADSNRRAEPAIKLARQLRRRVISRRWRKLVGSK